MEMGGFPDGPVVKNLPCNAGDTGTTPGQERSYMPFLFAALDCQHFRGPPSCISLFSVYVCLGKYLLNKLLTNQIREGLLHQGIQGPLSLSAGLWLHRAELRETLP